MTLWVLMIAGVTLIFSMFVMGLILDDIEDNMKELLKMDF